MNHLKAGLGLGLGLGLLLLSQHAWPAEPVITTFAGGGSGVDIGDGGPAAAARLESPLSVAVDAVGNVYIAEGADSYTSCRVRKVDSAGTITTFAGDGTRDKNGENVPATSVSVCPRALALDGAGNLYIGEHSRVRRVTAAGIISTVAGTGTWGFSGDGGPATSARIGVVSDIAVDTLGRLYIVDNASQRIRRVDGNGIIRTIAGNGEFHASGDGGPALSAGMAPRAVLVDSAGHVYFSDGSNDTVRRITPAGIVSRVAGKGPFRVDPFAVNSDLYFPWGLALDPDGNLYIANEANLVHLISPAGILKVIAGAYNDSTFSPYGAWWGFEGDGGAATTALLNRPRDVALDASGNVYIADTNNHRIRKITPVRPAAVPVGAYAFRPVVSYPVGAYNGALTVGEFNGDRRWDVVVATGSWGGDRADPAVDYSLTLFLQQSDGTLAAPIRLAFTPPRYVGRLRSADLNGDGFSDVVFATEAGLNVYFGGPSGLRVGPVLRGETNAEVPSDFILGDIDLDGRIDIVAWMGGRSEGGTSPTDMLGITIFYGDGQGGMARRRFLQQSIYAGELAWGDVNRDGRADLISTWAQDASDSGVAVFLHDGVDAFHLPQIVKLGQGGFGRGIAAGDFDHDGMLDVVVSRNVNAPRAALARFRQTSANVLVPETVWKTYDKASELVGRDMDGDGRDDLLILHEGWNSVGYQRQIPAVGASALDVAVKYRVNTSNRVHGGLASADLNGDGCLDVALSDNNHGLQVLYANDCLRTPPARAPLRPPSTFDTLSGSSTQVASSPGETPDGTASPAWGDGVAAAVRRDSEHKSVVQYTRSDSRSRWAAIVIFLLTLPLLVLYLRR
jgi:hypothetical protein